MICPCGSKMPYNDCCKLAHTSLENAKTAEQLMRSRYTAFTMGNGDYLMKSHHSTTRPIKEKQDLVTWANSVIWVGLVIISKNRGLENQMEGTVEFKAHYLENGKPQTIHEKSKFVKENDLWMYISAL